MDIYHINYYIMYQVLNTFFFFCENVEYIYIYYFYFDNLSRKFIVLWVYHLSWYRKLLFENIFYFKGSAYAHVKIILSINLNDVNVIYLAEMNRTMLLCINTNICREQINHPFWWLYLSSSIYYLIKTWPGRRNRVSASYIVGT